MADYIEVRLVTLGETCDHIGMRPRVYLETSIASYLTARPSRNILLAAHQQITRRWWERRHRS